MKISNGYINDIVRTAVEAGKEIMKIYNDSSLSSHVDIKDDKSPLTLADTASNKIIVERLSNLFPDIPIISEEEKDIPYTERKDYKSFWLVDPLDGTKEFIKRNGEFTVNIALINEGIPELGVIYVPATDILYYTNNGNAYKRTDGKDQKLSVGNKKENRIAVRSRSHPSPEEQVIFERYKVIDYIAKGSSLKFCEVAEGKADLYYRHGPTMEWDTGAGQAILEQAGGSMYFGDNTDKRFSYNKESLLNPGFICFGFSV